DLLIQPQLVGDVVEGRGLLDRIAQLLQQRQDLLHASHAVFHAALPADRQVARNSEVQQRGRLSDQNGEGLRAARTDERVRVFPLRQAPYLDSETRSKKQIQRP